MPQFFFPTCPRCGEGVNIVETGVTYYTLGSISVNVETGQVEDSEPGKDWGTDVESIKYECQNTDKKKCDAKWDTLDDLFKEAVKKGVQYATSPV